MLTMRTEVEASIPKTNPNPVIEGTPKVSLYEQCREERIKENLQRMQNLGILNLSVKLRSETRPVKRPYGTSNSGQKSTPPLQPSRRSSRLESATPVIYTDGVNVKGKTCKRERVVIHQGPRPEIYTEEHEKLLGNTERSWTSFVDGYDKDGKRIYDPVKGKTCHQCRQKTLGLRTHCSECEMVQGQFCGDCLFMRYGEHVLEALENPNWICPVCRGICNCSLCRNHKGWVPTGPIYRRIAKLGYKSVAHYLIQTKRLQTDNTTPNQASAKRSLSFQEAKQISVNDDLLLPEEVPKLQYLENQNTDSLKKEEEDENANSARRSLSFSMPSVENQTSLVDVKVLDYVDPSKIDKQEHSYTNISDDVSRIQERTEQNSNLVTREDSYLLPWENQALVVVVSAQDKVLCNSVNARETRSKRKASLEPNPDSIGGRLRQRRRSQSGL